MAKRVCCKCSNGEKWRDAPGASASLHWDDLYRRDDYLFVPFKTWFVCQECIDRDLKHSPILWKVGCLIRATVSFLSFLATLLVFVVFGMFIGFEFGPNGAIVTLVVIACGIGVLSAAVSAIGRD